LVPNQTPEKVNQIVKKYLKAEFDSLLSRNVMEVNSLGTGMPWVADANHWNFQAGRAATQVNNEALDTPRKSYPLFHRRYTTKTQN
jgi:hypothetical protein